MSLHLVTSTKFDFDMFVRRAAEDKGPRHAIYQIAQNLGAEVHQPDKSKITWLDKVLAKVSGQPEHWALARGLMRELKETDIVYAAGEDCGIPLAILCKFRRRAPRLAMYMMFPGRKKTQVVMKLLNLQAVVQKFFVITGETRKFLANMLNISLDRVVRLPESTDEAFFKPGQGSFEKSRPLLAGAGMEQRDYKTLALATHDQEVEIKICAFSPNASSSQQFSMPDPVPENMEIRYFEFSELRDLYQSADIIVFSLLKNDFSAGTTALMEAVACRRPVIMTDNLGLARELIEKQLIVGVQPGDHQGLREAIGQLLANPEEATAMAERAYSHFLSYHTSDCYIKQISQALESIETPQGETIRLSTSHS